MANATVNGININYEIIGGDGPWVALINGGRRGYAELVPLAGKIAARGFRVLLHDRRNTAASDMSFAERDQTEEATWADDLCVLLAQHDALPAFVGGTSSGARTAMLVGIRHPEAVRGLLLLRVTGGAFAAGRLPENYYGQFIRMAEEGGMAAVCATEQYQERITANPASEGVLMDLGADEFIRVMSGWRDLFVAGADLPVMGVTQQELDGLKVPTIVIPGNDNTHSSESGRIAHRMIAGSEIHQLPIEDQDLPLVPFDEWKPLEEEITDVVTDFMRRAGG